MDELYAGVDDDTLVYAVAAAVVVAIATVVGAISAYCLPVCELAPSENDELLFGLTGVDGRDSSHGVEHCTEYAILWCSII